MARTKNPRKIAVIDFETDPFRHGRVPEPFACGIYIEGGEYIELWGDDCADRAADVLRERRLRVYAHNGGKFDYFFLLDHMGEKIKLINGRIAQARIGESELYDSWLILPVPLSGMDKDEIDYSIMEAGEREKPRNKKKILEYLKSDCVYLFEWVQRFIGEFGKKLTLASAAFDQLEKTGYPAKRTSSEAYDSEYRAYYFGGRTQAFAKGKFEGDYKIYDINSAYPRAMLDNHPCGFSAMKIENIDVGDLPLGQFYLATIRAVSRGALPVRDGNFVTYPDDDVVREYNTTCWEIRAGLETGTLDISEIIDITVWEDERNFSDYVNKFYSQKLNAKTCGDRPGELFAKLMLNSAYGKFGTDGRKYKEYRLIDVGELPVTDSEIEEADLLGIDVEEWLEGSGWSIECDTDFGKTVWCRPDPQDRFYNVATAASITGWVRAYLWREICSSEGVVYCDTDSIICERFCGDIDGGKIGAWDLEGEGNAVWIGGKKLYAFRLLSGKYKKAHKGAKLSAEEIIEIVEGGREVRWLNPAPSFSLTHGPRFVKRKLKVT